MQIKTITDYAIKAILSIAATEAGKSSKEISDEICVPREYLIQIAKPLKSAGILVASPGKNGGYFLGRPAKEITLWDILSVTEGIENINRCIINAQTCRRTNPENCPLRKVYASLQQQIQTFMQSITILDLLQGGYTLNQCLSVEQ